MRLYFTLLSLVVLFAIVSTTSAQVVVSDGTPETIHDSAVFELQSTSKGFLAPKMTTAERIAISPLTAGLLVFDITLNKFYVYSGSAWVTSASNWLGSTTRIKLLPKDFTGTLVGDGKGATSVMSVYSDSSSTTYGMETTGDNDGYLVAFVSIPSGYKATEIKIFGNEATAKYYIWEGDIESADNLSTPLGNSTVGSIIDFTDVASTDINYLIIAVEFPKKEEDQLWGGYITIEPI